MGGPAVDRLLEIEGGDLLARNADGVDQALGEPVGDRLPGRRRFDRDIAREPADTFHHRGQLNDFRSCVADGSEPGGRLRVHLGVGTGGRVGDYYPDDGTRFENQPRSLTELLEAVAASLETGAPYAGHRPIVTPDGTLDWAN